MILRQALAALTILTSCHLAYAEDPRNSVVKIIVNYDTANPFRPWQSGQTSNRYGSGVIISGNRILTNAHVAEDHTFIQVKKDGDPKLYIANVIAIQHECDLALLSMTDADFFKNTKSLEFGEFPNIQDEVRVIGYPIGGDKISITKGVVSRIEVNQYVQSERRLLAVQIDAAINSGNSGGPVIKDDSIVGIAMQSIENAQNTGYMIPLPVINHFLKDLEDGKLDGFPTLGIRAATTENAALRKDYQIEDILGGVLVTYINPGSSADGNLEVGDVITEIDGIPIAEDATYLFRPNERIRLSNIISDKQVGDSLTLSISRKGKIIKNEYLLKNSTNLVPHLNQYEKPSYYIYGGLAFSRLTSELLHAWGDNWQTTAPANMLTYYNNTDQSSKDKGHKNKVILLGALPGEINVGYHQYYNRIINTVNGKDIKSFKQFVSLLHAQKTKRDRAVIRTTNDEVIIIDNKLVDESDAATLQRYNIAKRYSDDVRSWIE